jgi:lactoylglutathione lyase
MNQSISKVSLLVRDYDEALEFFKTKLQFEVVNDTDLGNGQRFLSVSPPCSAPDTKGADLVLTKASAKQLQYLGKQAGSGVLLFLNSDDFCRDYQNMQAAGVQFLEEPREEVYATVVVFEDLYGNKWDLLQAKF